MSVKISIAYSPDTDDAFMVHALKEGLIDWRGYDFQFTSADIQELNEAARQGVFDVTAISIAAYPRIADDYLLMTIGASIGDEFGPAVVVRPNAAFESLADLRFRRIAVPGRDTSAFYAARGLIGPFEEVPMYFKDIANAVARGDVDAGILIHELQLDCAKSGLRKLGDLGRAWHESYHMPLPLGANAIRRSLGDVAIREISEMLKQSIEFGLASRTTTLSAALNASGAPIDLELGDRYINMYVNRRSLGFEQDVRKAMHKLISIGVEQGLCRPLNLETCMAEV